MKKRNIVILGSTGSIGVNALRVVERFPERFRIVGLTAYNNLKLLEDQVARFKPTHIAVNAKGSEHFKRKIALKNVRVLDVNCDLPELVSLKKVDVVVIGMRGSAALEPFLAAVRAGKTIAPANKEALVIAGDIIMREAQKFQAKIIPVDSEQSAIFQCLEGRKKEDLKTVILTASGGALLKIPKSKFNGLSVDQILKHPRWNMGKKITVDSATLMNKGFEVIEAVRLFDLNVNQIKVLVHPQAIVHSMVEFKDGAIMAQLGIPDMRLPIQYALSHPERWDTGLKGLDFLVENKFTFKKPDLKKFPSLALAIDVAKKGGTLPSVLNAADEEAVEAFLNKRISFSKIYEVVEKIVIKHKIVRHPSLKDILEADQWGREEALRVSCSSN